MSIKYAILGLLQYTDMHGYRIKEHIEQNFGYMWSVNFGQIYPNLRDLEENGMIVIADITPSDEGGPQKKCYAITEEGKEEFRRWLGNSPERQMLLRDPFLLKFAFFGFGDKERALEIIDEQIALYEKQLAQRKGNKERWKRQGVYVRLLADLGIMQNEMFLQWLVNAREEIAHSREGVTAGTMS
ncbi:MAG TPA: PadR family transcriptional regulator [Spirochaetota bacterium]|nr:PadR family transcriptional regulator [Spirochaetota bacterium]HPJ39098.1 PadR family transcriptional regulator [Spirochaetota bacterium]HPQ55005.1 PadR family transcriptional regulator [Spirochaetota bacterium]